MRKKKFIAALLAFSLTLPSAAPVFAGLGAPILPLYNYSNPRYASDNSAYNEIHGDDGNVISESEIPPDEKPPGEDFLGGDSPDYDDPPPFEIYDDPPRTSDWSDELVTGIEISNREEGLNMEGEVPSVSDDFGIAAAFLNDEIDAAVKRRIRLAKDARSRNISFSYDIFSDSDMVSVIIRSTVTSATSKTEFDSVNFDPSDGDLMDLTDAVHFDIAPLADKILSERIRRDPETYNVGFDTSSIAENPFYLEDDHVTILFDDFQLSSAADGVNELRLDLNGIRQIEIERSEYRINRDYNLRMIPLKQVCRGLGYDTEWAVEEGRVYIYLDGEQVSDLEPGVNDYEEYGRRMRSLETAPEMYADTVYVPISFFDQILSWITYTVDQNDNITFYSYDE